VSHHSATGRQYPAHSRPVTLTQIESYARALDEDNPRYFGQDAIAPPLMVVTATLPDAIIPAVSDPELVPDPSALIRLLHGEEEVHWHAPLRAGDTLVTTGYVARVEDKSSGRLLVIGARLTNQHGAAVAETLSTLFIREPGKGNSDKKAPSEPHVHTPPPAQWTVDWRVAADQSLRYAEASGDHNPIHVDDDMARALGQKGRILHGLCTMGFAVRAIVDGRLERDPSRLASLHVRFAKPVHMHDELTFRAWSVGEAMGLLELGCEVVNQDGIAVLSGGRATIRTA